MPRGVTAVRALREAGVVVAAGADNLQDPFNPLGRACPFETAALMVLTAHLQPEDAWTCVTEMAARATGLPPARIAAGEPADLIAVRGVVTARGDRHGRTRPSGVATRGGGQRRRDATFAAAAFFFAGFAGAPATSGSSGAP